MDTITLGAAAVGLLIVVGFAVVRIRQATQLSVPDHPLWPPDYFYPKLALKLEVDAPATGEYRIPQQPTGTPIAPAANTGPKSAHSGIPISNAPMTNIPANWSTEREADGTMAAMPAYNPSPVTPDMTFERAPQQQPRHDTNPNAAETLISSVNATAISKPDESWIGGSTNMLRHSDIKPPADDAKGDQSDAIDNDAKPTSRFPQPKS